MGSTGIWSIACIDQTGNSAIADAWPTARRSAGVKIAPQRAREQRAFSSPRADLEHENDVLGLIGQAIRPSLLSHGTMGALAA
jgi:hypothetical protein